MNSNVFIILNVFVPSNVIYYLRNLHEKDTVQHTIHPRTYNPPQNIQSTLCYKFDVTLLKGTGLIHFETSFLYFLIKFRPHQPTLWPGHLGIQWLGKCEILVRYGFSVTKFFVPFHLLTILPYK